MTRRNWIPGRVIAVTMAAGFWSSAVLADPIPEEILVAHEDECRFDCEEVNEAELCEALCSCAIKRIDRKFDYDAFLEFKQEMASGLISDENQNFSAETGLVCADEAERLLVRRQRQSDPKQQ